MNLDPGIICYEHCTKGRLFAYELPPFCDLCQADLAQEPLLQPPFRLPFPFVRASQVPCCLVIKPNRGDFLHDYKNHKDLHIGLTDSEGRVHEFNCEGLRSDYTSSWDQCIPVPILSGSLSVTPDPVWKEYWDFTLHSLPKEDWTEERYNEESYNCYTFVLEFLKALRPPNINIKTLSKATFCASFMIPHTSSAAKYISVYRRLLRRSVLAISREKKNDKSHLPIQQNTISTTRC